MRLERRIDAHDALGDRKVALVLANLRRGVVVIVAAPVGAGAEAVEVLQSQVKTLRRKMNKNKFKYLHSIQKY